MFGFSRQVNFAVRVGLIGKDEGTDMIAALERKLADLWVEFPSQK